MTEPRIALALIVKGSDEEAKLLDRCLASVSPFVDRIFITMTTPKGWKQNEEVPKIVRKYNGSLSYFEWVDDFAAARNYNFSQVPISRTCGSCAGSGEDPIELAESCPSCNGTGKTGYDFILWTDADDIWRGLDKLKATLKEHQHVDAFGFEYLYDWDEFNRPTVVHTKTMLVKNDNCVTWVGELHEDLQENRQLDVFVVKGIERLHLTTKERATENAKRNIEIAKKQAKENPDDPRGLWNLGNSYIGVADYAKAREAFLEFIEETESKDEKYLAYQRLSEACANLEMREDSIKNLQFAIGLIPDLPDAYLQLAGLYYAYGNWDEAENYGIQGLLRRPQPERMIVYNPRDYDYNPLMLMAKLYYQKNRPDYMLTMLEGCLKIYPQDKELQKMVREGKEEKKAYEKALEEIKELQVLEDKDELKKRIDALPQEIRSHPAVCALRNQNFVKTESSGKDLVIYCGNTHDQWNPELFKTKGFGGSEEAVVHLAREWAKLGWNVTVYNNCGHKAVQEIIPEVKNIAHLSDGADTSVNSPIVTYRPFWEWNYRDKQDVTILWRWLKPLDADINSTKIFLDVHDFVTEGEFTPKRVEKLDKIFMKSQWHRDLLPSVPDSKIAVVPNGMASYLDPSIKKDPFLVINTSSPDRSMDVLPKLWKQVKERLPEDIRAQVRFKWCYGFDLFKSSNTEKKKLEWMDETLKAIEDAGIENLGKIPQSEVGKLYQEAGVLAYPSEFAEISCISVLKAQAAKCVPVTTDFAALAESNKFGIAIHSGKNSKSWNKPYQFHFGIETEEEQKAWVAYMVGVLTGGLKTDWDGLDEWVEGFKWENIAKRWNDNF